MRKFIPFVLILMVSLAVQAQKQIYSNAKEGVNFTYPSKFQKSIIQSASHMLLKLENGSQTIALSKWSYGLDASYTIWDEEIVQLTKENVRRTGASLISIDKRYLNTIQGKKKSLVSIVNMRQYNMHAVTYQFLHKGNLWQIVIANSGAYNKSLLSTYDGYISGLSLK